MRRRGRDVGVTHRRGQAFVGDRRIVVGVDQIVRHPGMIAVLRELGLEDRRALRRPGEGLVGRRLGRNQIDRREDLGLVVIGILLGQGLESVGHRTQPRRMGPLGEFVVIGADRLDIAALALGLGADRPALGDCLLRPLGALRRGAGRVGIADRQRGDPPGRDRTGRVLHQHLAERLVALAPPERVEQCHRALQLRLDRRRTGVCEGHRAELFGRPGAGCRDRQDGDGNRGCRASE